MTIKKITSPALLITLLTTMLSCESFFERNSFDTFDTENTSPTSTTNKTSNFSTLESINYTDIKPGFADTISPVIENANLIFRYSKHKISVKSALLDNGNYIFDIDGDNKIDLQIQPINKDYSEVYYLDENGNKISKAKLSKEAGIAHITILEVYKSDSKYGSLVEKGKWRQCFESVAGSAYGIAGSVACSFGGPWCVAGFYSGIAIGCAFA